MIVRSLKKGTVIGGLGAMYGAGATGIVGLPMIAYPLGVIGGTYVGARVAPDLVAKKRLKRVS